MNSRLSTVPDLLAAGPAGPFHAVVVTAGMMEAIDLVPDRVWERWLVAVLEMVQSRFGSDITVIVTGMPVPTSTVLAGVGRRGWFIDRRATGLNRTSRTVATKRTHWHFAQLKPSEHVNGQPTSDSYVEWAEHICDTLAPALSAARA